jgi:hypothetical protein
VSSKQCLAIAADALAAADADGVRALLG